MSALRRVSVQASRRRQVDKYVLAEQPASECRAVLDDPGAQAEGTAAPHSI